MKYNPKYRHDDDNEFNNETWQTSFLDIFMLLLAFFIILAGLARFDMAIFADDARGLRSLIQGTQKVVTPINELDQDLHEKLRFKIADNRLEIVTERDELRLKFTDAAFYETAEAVLLPEGKDIIDQIIEVLDKLQFYQYNIDVEGHTDNRPIQTNQFPSNWELSTARAANIIKYFIELGFEPSRLKASGFADTRPVAQNQDQFGNDIPENQALNRRVVIRIYY
jgi:chemotaxis protein MotB